MKEEKLFDMVNNIDDDLICEMLEYSPEIKEEEWEKETHFIPKRGKNIHFWKYAAMAGAFISITGIALIIISSGNRVPNEYTPVITENIQSGADITENINTEYSEETTASIDDPNSRITADKAVKIDNTNVLFTTQYPEIPKPDLSRAEFTQMSTSELCKYYGLEEILSNITYGYINSSGETITHFTEISDENSHGIYTLENGSVYDINQFTFETMDNPDNAKRITVTVGKDCVFGQEYDPRPDYKIGQTVYYNKEKDTFFMIYEKYGSCIMISGKTEDLSDFEDPLIKEIFDYRSDEQWQEVPKELMLFISGVNDCVGYFQNITLEDWNNVDGTTQIIPDKVVALGYTMSSYVLFTERYPEIAKPDLSEAEFTEMSISELCGYYGLPNILSAIENGNLAEDKSKNTSHGIYTLPDGSIYDINTFIFTIPYDDGIHGKKFTVTAGKNTTFGKEYNQNPILKGSTMYYNEKDGTFFEVLERNGSCVMFSANADELSDFDDPALKEKYRVMSDGYNEKIWKGVPCEYELFIQDIAQCMIEVHRDN